MKSNFPQTSDVEDFKAVEFLVSEDKLNETGRTEFYAAWNADDAVKRCLKAHHTHNPQAFVGPSGRVIYCGHLAYTVLQDG